MSIELIKKSGVKDQAEDLNVGSDVYSRLDELASELLEDGIRRARENGRSTLMSKDL